MSGSLLHNGLKRSVSASAGVYSHYVFTQLDVRQTCFGLFLLWSPFVFFLTVSSVRFFGRALGFIHIVHVPSRAAQKIKARLRLVKNCADRDLIGCDENKRLWAIKIDISTHRKSIFTLWLKLNLLSFWQLLSAFIKIITDDWWAFFVTITRCNGNILSLKASHSCDPESSCDESGFRCGFIAHFWGLAVIFSHIQSQRVSENDIFSQFPLMLSESFNAFSILRTITDFSSSPAAFMLHSHACCSKYKALLKNNPSPQKENWAAPVNTIWTHSNVCPPTPPPMLSLFSVPIIMAQQEEKTTQHGRETKRQLPTQIPGVVLIQF